MPHHAYYKEGPLAEFDACCAALRPLWSKRSEAFGVDDARRLIELASLKNAADALFVLGVSSITSEAQQALLKLFEEPVPGTVFVLVLPHGVLLPTLRSRMLALPETLPQGSAGKEPFFEEARAFLKARGKARSDIVAKLLKDDEGAKERAREFLNALERALAPRIDEAPARAGLEDLSRVRDYLRDRSPSLKMLLEHLAVSLPALA